MPGIGRGFKSHLYPSLAWCLWTHSLILTVCSAMAECQTWLLKGLWGLSAERLSPCPGHEDHRGYQEGSFIFSLL